MSSNEIKLPYVVQPAKIREWFNKIGEVETPPTFTTKFIENVMLFKSKNDRNLIGLLKSLDFINEKGVPTQQYSDYKIDDLSKTTIAKGIRKAYNEIYRRNKNFHDLDDERLKGYVKSITKLGEDSSVVPLIVKTLRYLLQLGDFTHSESPVKRGEEITIIPRKTEKLPIGIDSPLKLNYTVSINLPASGTQETYDKIFESIKKILLSK